MRFQFTPPCTGFPSHLQLPAATLNRSSSCARNNQEPSAWGVNSSMNVNKASPPVPGSKIEEYESVRMWSENLQRVHGDCLSEDVMLPPRGIHFPENQFESLKRAWNELSSERKKEFEGKYGYIAELLFVQIDLSVLRAMIKHWDPAYSCFTFGSVDMTPIIEEYQSILHMPCPMEYKVYCHDESSTMKRALSSFLGKIRASEIDKQLTTKGENICISEEYLMNLRLKFIGDTRELALLALCIYSAVLFPKVVGYVEERVVKLFTKVEAGANPIMPILAETFRSLNHCRSQKGEKFIGCAPLLYVWIFSHIECPSEFNVPKLKFSSSWNLKQNPISEFTKADWSQDLPAKEVWMNFFSTLQAENTIWRAVWMSTKPMMYRCGEFGSIPLLGPWGCVSYAPLLVLRQIGLKQFIPATNDLRCSEFTYDSVGSKSKIHKMEIAWNSVHIIQGGRNCNATTEEYDLWHSKRGKSLINSHDHERIERMDEDPKVAQVLEQISRDDELISLRTKNSSIMLENERLREEIRLERLRNAKQEEELQRLRNSAKDQERLENEVATLDTEVREINRRMHKLRKDKGILQEVVKAQDDQIARHQSDTESYRSLVEELQGIIDTRNKEIAKMEEDNCFLRRTIDDWQLGVNEAEAHLIRARDENAKLRETAQSLINRLERCQNASECLMGEYKHLESQYLGLKNDFGSLNQENSRLRHNIEQVVRQVRKACSRADQLALEASALEVLIVPSQLYSKKMIRFLGKIREDLGQWGQFY